MAQHEKTAAEFAQAIRAARTWIEKVAPVQFPGYIDNDSNKTVLLGYIYDEGGLVTVDNLTAAATACAHKLEGLQNGEYIQRKADLAKAEAEKAKAAAEKVIEDKKNLVRAENTRVVNLWIKDCAPRSLLVGNEVYPPTADAMVALIHQNYPKVRDAEQVITVEQLQAVVDTLWGSLPKFSTKPEDNVYRNQPVKVRELSQRQKVEAGLEQDPASRRNDHKDDGKMISMQETARRAKEVHDKRNGIPSEEDQYKVKLEAISVAGRTGKLDHGTTAALRAVRVLNRDGSVNWKTSFEAADHRANQYEKEKNR